MEHISHTYNKQRRSLILDQDTSFSGSMTCIDCRHWKITTFCRNGCKYGECHSKATSDLRDYSAPPLYPQDTKCIYGAYRPSLNVIKDDPNYEMHIAKTRQWAQKRRIKRRQLAKIYDQ